ncbi:tryptophan-rich sensory protein [Candidatus Peregrinibacteria bacterium]|jgi:translocator protein|nr:tryptophan-rich sensory protein [Candidatus Peregrinibacteria bacterium]MBT4147652.1 tryptophan-rich sensory protein [Candidatus Peregrinibacteria bacterium]MBT4366292.1 tryptophan-rich sensory protein [Candidatus Peregrinibacteria bacterium]MBT4456258.1 tryptophan-rich sensory protein [Candidatus Peregrinibacteria bacterium]
MKIKPNYILIPLIAIAIAVGGSMLTGAGMEWYETTLIKPDLTPPKIAFPIAWNLIFVCTTISALIIFNKAKKNKHYKILLILFTANAILNVLWSYLFFGIGDVQAALIEMIFIEATIIALMVLMWKNFRLATGLLIPYLLWVGFATYLTYQILNLNL